ITVSTSNSSYKMAADGTDQITSRVTTLGTGEATTETFTYNADATLKSSLAETVKAGIKISSSVSSYKMGLDGRDQIQNRVTTLGTGEATTENFAYNSDGTLQSSTATTVKAGITVSTSNSSYKMAADGTDQITSRVTTLGTGEATTETFTYNADATLKSSLAETVKAGIKISSSVSSYKMGLDGRDQIQNRVTTLGTGEATTENFVYNADGTLQSSTATTVKAGITISTAVSSFRMAADGTDQISTRVTTLGTGEATTENFSFNPDGTLKNSTATTVKAGVTISTSVSNYQMGLDGRDQIQNRVTTLGTGEATTENFAYNADGTLKSVVADTVKAGIKISSSVSSYKMGLDGRDQIQHRVTTLGTGEATTENFAYNSDGTLKSSTATTVKAGITVSTSNSSYKMAADGTDQITSRVTTLGTGEATTETFTYNADATLKSSLAETVKAGIKISSSVSSYKMGLDGRDQIQNRVTTLGTGEATTENFVYNADGTLQSSTATTVKAGITISTA